MSERIKMHGADRPVVGDLVFDTDTPEEASDDKDELAQNEGLVDAPAEDKVTPEDDGKESGLKSHVLNLMTILQRLRVPPPDPGDPENLGSHQRSKHSQKRI